MKEYIGSDEHFQDSVNAHYEKQEEINKQQQKEIDNQIKAEKFDFELKPMQISVYALNCPKEDKYFEEVADLIERYADTKVYNELEAPYEEFENKVLKTLKSMTLSMAAHPDCIKGSEFFDLVSIAEKVIEGTLDTNNGNI